MNLAEEHAFGYLQYGTNVGLVGTGAPCTAIKSLASRLVNQFLAPITENMGLTQRKLQCDQIRFMSPKRGVL
ncbi:L-galactonate dehydratase [Penicillium herquei]|nr:L-galactonate dehydratase [Penicillium herquei]